MILGKRILCYSTLETILVYLVSKTRKMFRQNRTPKKGNQLWELVLAPREATIVGRPFWPPINKRRASCAPPSTASCLRPTFTRFTIRLNRGRAQVVAPSNESFGVRWEAQRHTAFLRFASIANHLANWRITPGRKKRRRPFALPAQSKKCDKKMSPNRFRRQLANDVARSPVDVLKEIVVPRSAP
jgi:hypothetical protein